MPKHVRFYEQTNRSGIVSDLSRIGLRFGRMRMAANVLVLDLVNAASNLCEIKSVLRVITLVQVWRTGDAGIASSQPSEGITSAISVPEV